MTRRDMIIVAVLANIGVLAILFMLAFRTEEDKSNESGQIAYTVTEEPVRHVPIEIKPSVEPSDMIDTTLKDDGEEDTPVVSSLASDDENFQLVEPDEPQQPVKKVEPVSTSSDTTPTRIVEITIKRGDALEKIARANGTTVEAIMKENNLKNDRLRIGQIIKVPLGASLGAGKKVASLSTNTPKPVADSTIEYYTIKSGDNPWKIAKQYHLKLDELLKLNNMDEEKARNLKIGDKIRVR